METESGEGHLGILIHALQPRPTPEETERAEFFNTGISGSSRT
jgi:hypothetical protein